MKLGVLFSGGKDSTYAAWVAKNSGHEISCLISILSENKFSYMFHTPSILLVEKQAEKMGTPILLKKTKGEEEIELCDLREAIREAKETYSIEGIVTGAVESVYQASRIQRICCEEGLECFNPLWQKDQIEILEDLIKNNFEIIVVGVFAYPLDRNFLGRSLDSDFISDMKKLSKKYKINPAGEGGEFESFVLNCPLFSSALEIHNSEDFGSENSWRREISLK